jgi:hypothetical protein
MQPALPFPEGDPGMPRIGFWNVQRLGDGSPAEKRAKINELVEEYQPDYMFFCELTTTDPLAQNLTYRKKKSEQLCYGCMQRDGTVVNLGIADMVPTEEYEVASFKGGTSLSRLCNRAIGHIPSGDPTAFPHLYVLHAPASNDAIKVLSYIACSLNEEHGTDAWLLIGDFNVEPIVLARSRVGIRMDDLIKSSGEHTHRNGSELDYCLSNMEGVTVTRADRMSPSDHFAIFADW